MSVLLAFGYEMSDMFGVPQIIIRDSCMENPGGRGKTPPPRPCEPWSLAPSAFVGALAAPFDLTEEKIKAWPKTWVLPRGRAKPAFPAACEDGRGEGGVRRHMIVALGLLGQLAATRSVL